MKAVILAGGFGTRLSEHTGVMPKPLVEVGGKPILWHIMNIYASHGIKEFVVLCGYKGYMIKEYFSNYSLKNADVTFDLGKHTKTIHKNGAEDWKVTLIDTGETTMTGGRIKRAQEYIGNETFCLTYGDGVSNIDIKKLIEFHKAEKSLATVTAVQPPGRFGIFNLEEGETRVTSFREKDVKDTGWINAGFYVLEPGIFDYITEGDQTIWEQSPMRNLAHEGKLSAYRHEGFWQCMDTLRDRMVLEELWAKGKAPWKAWVDGK
jgi:glucose-1-phosphate cytidylyltransferase